MSKEEREEYSFLLHENLLKGGSSVSEWTVFMASDAEVAFCNGANISSILACQAAIESHLRYDYFSTVDTKRWGFYQLINESSLDMNLKVKLHKLRIYRNKWVHISDPNDDSELIFNSVFFEKEIEDMAIESIKIMLETLYSNPFI